jgi:hypothetical protein
MSRDGVANIVNKLHQRGFDPRRVGEDAWESRCPVHGGKEHVLRIARNDRQEIVLHCRNRKCPPAKIVSALDLTVTGCAIEAFETWARCHGTNTTISIRLGSDAADSPSPTYIDLGDPSGRAVAVNASGWSIVDRPPVAFRRPEGLLSLPFPSRDGSIELLRPYVNLTDRDFRLLIAWLAAALRPLGPYPILALYGEQGSAKRTLARVARMLVDPHSAPLLVEPKSTRDLAVEQTHLIKNGHKGK